MGIDEQPAYLIPQADVARRTEMIADHWRRQWLATRISRAGILDEVGAHTLRYPITNGAVVPVPPGDDVYSS